MSNFLKDKQSKTDGIQTNSKHNFSLSALWEFWAPIFVTLFLYSGIRYFLAEARYIPSGSMLPTLQINDRLIVEKITYRRRKPKRGEIVVFNSPHSFDPALIARRRSPMPSSIKCAISNFPLINFFSGIVDPACHAYIKRVVAIAGDKVVVDQEGKLYLNNNFINEPYFSESCSLLFQCKVFEKKVPPKHVFVLGDNRGNSWDGRFWPGSGFLPEKEILGRAIWIFWPFERTGKIY